jgi:chemotaxis protein MotB
MSDDTQQPIVVKRIKKGGGAHHGGAWKIAYADFVTVMMAFFLLMWLMGSTSQGDLKGLSDHFASPMKLSLMGGAGTGDATSILQGGGEDITRSAGHPRRGVVIDNRVISHETSRQFDSISASEEMEQIEERAKLLDLKGKVEALIEANPDFQQLRDQLLIDITTEGLRIQIVDEKNRPMFDLASDRVRPYTRALMRELGRILNDVPNRISLSGHTDSLPFAGGDRGFSNWELSANRANASRRELGIGGLEQDKVIRVVGLSDMVHLNQDDPTDPINRRISIIVLNKRTEKAIRDSGSRTPVVSVDVDEAAPESQRLANPAVGNPVLDPPPNTGAPPVPVPAPRPPPAPAAPTPALAPEAALSEPLEPYIPSFRRTRD